MKCSLCGLEQPEGAAVCAYCRTTLVPDEVASESSLKAARAIAARLSHLSSAPPPEPPSVLKLAGGFLGALLFAFGLYWLSGPGGGEVPPDAVRHEELGYALSPPNGWTVLTNQNYNELTKQFGPLPANIRNDVQVGRIHLGVIKLVRGMDFAPSVIVVLATEPVPPLDDEHKSEAVTAMTRPLAGRVKEFKLLKADLLDIDDLASLKLSMSGTFSLKVNEEKGLFVLGDDGERIPSGVQPAQWQEEHVQYSQLVVPGHHRTYVLTASALQGEFKQYERSFDQTFASFRVVDRPRMFDPVVTIGLQAVMVSGMVYLLYVFVAGVVGRIRQ